MLAVLGSSGGYRQSKGSKGYWGCKGYQLCNPCPPWDRGAGSGWGWQPCYGTRSLSHFIPLTGGGGQ